VIIFFFNQTLDAAVIHLAFIQNEINLFQKRKTSQKVQLIFRKINGLLDKL